MAPRKRWLRQPLSWQRGGAVALAVLIILMAAALVLDSDASAELAPVQEYIETRGTDPAAVVERAARSARVVLLADVYGQPGPKAVAAEAIRRLADGPGLDAVLLEVPSDEQPYIDAYLNRGQEDATVLLARPAAVREPEGVSREFLEIYRAVWQVNSEVGPARRIRVIAADMPGWPPPEGAPPEEVADLYAQRAEHMLMRLDRELFSIMPDARVLIFVDGYLALLRTHGRLTFAGGESKRVDWLGELLRQRSASDTRVVLTDAAAPTGAVLRLPRYHGTQLYRPLRRELDSSAGVRIDETFSVIRSPVLEMSAPGLRLEILPADYKLRQAADSYIFIEGS